MLWAEAVKKAGTTDREPVIKALESGISINGPAGKVSIDAVTHHCIFDMYLAVSTDATKSSIFSRYDQVRPTNPNDACDFLKHPDINMTVPAGKTMTEFCDQGSRADRGLAPTPMDFAAHRRYRSSLRDREPGPHLGIGLAIIFGMMRVNQFCARRVSDARRLCCGPADPRRGELVVLDAGDRADHCGRFSVS